MLRAAEPNNAKVDVLVVGAGPVGLMMAFCAARQGLQCRIIDVETEPEKQSRAIGIQSRTLEVFEMAGVVEEFVRLGHPVTAFNLYGRDGSRLLHIDFSKLPSRYAYLMTLPQDQTERILTERLLAAHVQVERPVRLDSFEHGKEGILARIVKADGSEGAVRCDWLIGCDGAHSRVRELLGLQFSGKTYDMQFLLADVQVETELSQDEGHGFSRASGLLAVFPLGNRHWRLIADNPAAGWEQREKPSLEELQTLIDARANVPIKISDANWAAYFHVNARIVENLRRGHAFVLGDAAHIHSPALAQGMNTGLQDAWNLAWKVALVQKGLARTELVDSYEPERLPVEQNVLKITDITQRVVANTDPKVQEARDVLAPIALRAAIVSNVARQRISELNIGYPKSPIVQNSMLPSGPRAGERAPDAEISLNGHPRRLYSLFGRKHVLLVLPHPKPSTGRSVELQRSLDHIADLYGAMLSVYPVVRDGRIEEGSIMDASGEITERYGGITALYLVRPDGYIAYRSGSSQIRKLEQYLEDWFIPGEKRQVLKRRAG